MRINCLIIHDYLTDHVFMQFWNYYQCEELTDETRQMIGRVNMVDDDQTFETDPEMFNKLGYYEWRSLLTG